MPDYVRYSEAVETIAPNEVETNRKIVEMMTDGQNVVREKLGHAVRISHGKSFGILAGTLTVADDLAPELAQGFFARPGSYDVVVRLASAPGEITDDSKLSTGHGMAIKIFDVEGEKLAPFEAISNQDFVLDTGKVFFAKNAQTFIGDFAPFAKVATRLSDDVKGVVSNIARVTSAALDTIGIDSPKLDFFGAQKQHPMAQAHYSQTPLRYGNYIAKLGAVPTSAAMKALEDVAYDAKTPDALREATVGYFAKHAAEFDIVVQLNVDLEQMPVEDAMAEWSEEASPYRKVATLVLPVQDAYDGARERYVDGQMSFNPAHTLLAHRPLGSINRARLVVYTALADIRRRENGEPLTEPARFADVPA